jgi:hypothetical protein
MKVTFQKSGEMPILRRVLKEAIMIVVRI